MAGRSAHVSALSDKISGLKFMQRAKALVTSQQAAASSSSSTEKDTRHSESAAALARATQKRDAKNALVGFPDEEAEASSAPRKESKKGGKKLEIASQPSVVAKADADENVGQDGNEEHWVLPSASKSNTSSSKSSASPNITIESGWHSWLGRLAEQDASASSSQNENAEQPSVRRSFGGWGEERRKKSKAREADDGDDDSASKGKSKRVKGMRDDPPGNADVDQQSRRKARAGQHEGKFMKPGSTSSGEAGGSSSQKGAALSAAAARKQKKGDKKQSGKRDKDAAQASSNDAARQDAAKRKRQDMASDSKAAKRKNAGFSVPDLSKDDDDSNSGDSLEGL